MIQSYRDLEVWRSAVQIAKDIYAVTRKFPAEERFGLASQLRRAAVSIPSNLAEGHARASTAEFQRFVLIALGSVAELETQLILASELGYVSNEQVHGLLRRLDTVGKMLRALHRSLANRKPRTSSPRSH